MDESEFEGTIVLEKMGEIGKVDEFFDALDSDDFREAERLMKRAGLDSETISMVLKKMADANGEH